MKIRLITILFLMIACAGCQQAHVRAAAQSARTSHNDIELVPRVHFLTASTKIIARDRAAVAQNAKWISQNPDAVLLLEGHCDERGSDRYNMELGDRRARSVAAMLAKKGADPKKLIIVSQGKRNPLDRRHNETAWRKNRRVEFIIR